MRPHFAMKVEEAGCIRMWRRSGGGLLCPLDDVDEAVAAEEKEVLQYYYHLKPRLIVMT